MPEAAQAQIRVTLPDGSVREVDPGVTIQQVAYEIGEGLGKATVGGRLDGESETRDLRSPLSGDCALQIVTANSEAGHEVIRHSAAHIMADAICRLWPDAKLAIGPAIDDGFYYDIDLEHRIGPDDLPKIEAEMAKVIDADTPFHRSAVDRDEKLAKARNENDIYKSELLEGLDSGEEVTFYTHGEGSFEDLCRGPHVPSTGYVKAFNVMRVAGAYWRGDEKNKMLQRIYGTAWWSKKDLKQYLTRLEEARKRDHRKLGRELRLFMINSDVAPASPFFLPKGATLYNTLQDYIRDLYVRFGYDEVITPQVFNVSLWHASGHYEHYKENMYFTDVEGAECAVKPMNCPGHTLIYSSELRSYRDLPIRIADFGRLHRYERSGVTHGLTRVRTFAQDDGHIFCSPNQIQGEITSLIEMFTEVYQVFRFDDLKICLSTRPEDSVGDAGIWEKAEAALTEALEGNDVAFDINEGDGAFYGPKIDFVVLDAIGREWQLGTIQLDFNLPDRFGLTYIDQEGQEQRPVMIHRAILGSLERFIGILIEHTGGAFPFWVAPVQARIITIADDHVEYGREVVKRFQDEGFRVEPDFSNAKTGAKIRDARLQRVPYRLVVGGREMENGTVAVKEHPDTDLGTLGVEEVIALFREKERKKE
ncbi:MAG: threonine--tRNA ligase [Planctomycetota bacterium]|nr:threonine--tRNA ligase [Planctomycetota bacterium]